MGVVKLLKHKENERTRLLMRQEKTLKVRANHIGESAGLAAMSGSHTGVHPACGRNYLSNAGPSTWMSEPLCQVRHAVCRGRAASQGTTAFALKHRCAGCKSASCMVSRGTSSMNVEWLGQACCAYADHQHAEQECFTAGG